MNAPLRARRPRSRGLTLIELVLVMGLISVVVGIGLGAFSSIDPGRRAAVGLVQNLVRTAHNTAVARRAPARVRIDPADGTIVAEGMDVLGTWHFEGFGLEGGDGLDGIVVGADDLSDAEGYLGGCLDFSASPRGARLEVPVQDDPAFEPREGFSLELSLRPSREGTGRVLSLGGVVELDVAAGGALQASFRRRRSDDLGRTTAGGWVRATTGGGALRPERWSRVAVHYDRRALRVVVDGVQLAVEASEEDVAPLAGPLQIGGETGVFPGRVDELAIAVVTGEVESRLPETVRFRKATPRSIDFVAGGALDPSRHPGPVEIELEFQDGTRDRVLVGIYGTVE